MSPDLVGFTKALGDVVEPLTLAFPRTLAMLSVLPLLPSSVFPLAIRNGVGLAMLLPAYPLLRLAIPDAPEGPVQWLLHIAKEVAIGAALGWGVGLLIWAFESVGGLLDIQTGTSSGAIFDPLTQQPSAVFAMLLRNLALAGFITVGGLLALLGVFYESLRVWPVTAPMPIDAATAWRVGLDSSTQLLAATLSVALPFIVVLLLIELGLGLVNRSLPQLNVFQLSMPVKMTGALVMLLVALSHLLDVVVRFVARHQSLAAFF